MRKFLKFDFFVCGASLLGIGFCFVSMSGDLEFPWSARRIAFVYAFVSGFYILFSDRIIVVVENDGVEVPAEVRHLLTVKQYYGETTGVGGLRFYLISRLIDENNVELKIKESGLGGSKYEIHFPESNHPA